ncbi:MAG: cytochrome C oxidase Cbb3 [Maribacter sp.]|nr:MAG: cytochrome C oxidase Cbb3 [Maribacter sp.]
MKINWGTGIVLAFIAFISFILFFVIQMSTNDQAKHDLVTEEYYKVELEYQKEIDAEINASKLPGKITLEKTKEGLILLFPEDFDTKNIEGTVSLYRPSNKHLDFDLPISLSNLHLLIPDERLLDGRWDIRISWRHKGKDFLQKESITY